MNPLPALHPGAQPSRRLRQLGQTRIAPLIAVFIAGVVATAFWFSYQGRPKGPAEIVLSQGTKSVLQQLDAPVEIRFYSQLDTSSVPASVQAFAQRTDRLVAAYEREGGGKIKVSLFDTPANFNPDAASADGVKPFNLSKGDACYLGIVVVRNSQKETLPHLAPEWEPALESDLTRAIARLVEPAPQAPVVVSAPIDPATVAEVKRALPNAATVPLEDGKQALRDAGLAEFTQATKELQAKLKEAQQNVLQAQNEADKQAAIKQLQAVQAEQMEKLTEIAAKAQAQTEALEQIKRDAAK